MNHNQWNKSRSELYRVCVNIYFITLSNKKIPNKPVTPLTVRAF